MDGHWKNNSRALYYQVCEFGPVVNLGALCKDHLCPKSGSWRSTNKYVCIKAEEAVTFNTQGK
jgi:hypothetical protein